ncbi:MAG: STAS/SEC14 domain-containing protein [Pseudomonadota bacterium]
MFEITKPSANRVDLHVSGAIDSDTMRKALDDLIEKSEGIENGRMLYTIPEMAWPSLGALGVEMARLPKLFGLLGKFDRCAVLTDAGWIKTAAEVEGALFPGIEIKGFGLTEVDKAEAWLADKG